MVSDWSEYGKYPENKFYPDKLSEYFKAQQKARNESDGEIQNEANPCSLGNKVRHCIKRLSVKPVNKISVIRIE